MILNLFKSLRGLFGWCIKIRQVYDAGIKEKNGKKSGNDISGEYRSSKYAVQICSEIFILVQHLLFLEKC